MVDPHASKPSAEEEMPGEEAEDQGLESAPSEDDGTLPPSMSAIDRERAPSLVISRAANMATVVSALVAIGALILSLWVQHVSSITGDKVAAQQDRLIEIQTRAVRAEEA
jgi:hypothetical protein